jgi:DNA-binding LacI/PurR family transcriptional regulator
MPATIGDVARLAGVGRGTVSRVLNDRPNVDPATRERVQRAIAELDFVPSLTARRLSLGRTNTIMVVGPFLTRPSAVERLSGIQAALSATSLDAVSTSVETTERRVAVIRDASRPERADGLILIHIAPSTIELERILAAGIPCVLVDAHHRRLPRVVVDDVDGGQLAARHLLDLGHKRIGFIGEVPLAEFGFSSTRLRLRGVVRVLRSAGIAIPDEHVIRGEHNREGARLSALALLAGERPPTAIIAASDTEAMGVLEAARIRGLRVPEDLSVIGYDDIDVADFIGLTTIRQPLFRTGTRAVERLLGIIAGDDPRPLREVLPVELVVRSTTGPAPV